jgi:hypothetical protein
MAVLMVVVVVADLAVVLGRAAQVLVQQGHLGKDIMELVVVIVLAVAAALLELELLQTVVQVLNGQQVLPYIMQVAAAEQAALVELAVVVVAEYHMVLQVQLTQVVAVVLDNLRITQLVEVAARVLLYFISHRQVILEQQQLVRQL